MPNPGFEQGGCGDTTPVICNWYGESIYQDPTNPHSGSASMAVNCGSSGCFDFCFPDDWCATAMIWANSVCVPVAPGTLPASFLYRTGAPEIWRVVMEMRAFQSADCTGSADIGRFGDYPTGDDAWHQISGEFIAPSGTQSAAFHVEAWGCDGCFF